MMGERWWIFTVIIILIAVILVVEVQAVKKKRKATVKSSSSQEVHKDAKTNSEWDDARELLAIPVEKRQAKSYLFVEAHPQDITSNFIQDIVDVIHARQNPSKSKCLSKRLLILQMTSNSFEGTGSLLKQMMLATAIAMHSNRTLIWGLGLPFIFEHTKEIWNGQRDLSKITVCNETIDCRQGDPSGGPLGCFLEPISTCSLGDATPAELISFSENAYNHTARLALAEMYKGISLYHPPMGLFDYIWFKRKYPASFMAKIMEKQSYIWSAAVAAYVFRIKSGLLTSLTKKFSHMFPEPTSLRLDSVERRKKEITWGMHVRHGDLKAMANVYSYKEVFEFDDYFAAGLKVSHVMKQRPDRIFVSTDSIEADDVQKKFQNFMSQRQEKWNQNDDRIDEISEYEDIYDEEDSNDVSSEELDKSAHTDEKEEEKDGVEKNDVDEEEWDEDSNDELLRIIRKRRTDLNSYHSWWTDVQTDKEYFIPSIFTIPNSARYRTPHGSHTVAANGGCLRDEKYQQKGMRCALTYDAIIQYQSMEEHRSQPRSMRLMRVLLESIEDLYLLSRCDALIAQGSSHFSTLSALLIWARTLGDMDEDSLPEFGSSARYLQRVYFLDNESIRVGFTPTGFLHGMNLLNGTKSVDTASLTAGALRWQIHTTHFLPALPTSASWTLFFPMAIGDKEGIARKWASSRLLSNPSNLPNIYLGDHFPQYSLELFYLESRHWLGDINTSLSTLLNGKKTGSFVEFVDERSVFPDYVPYLPGQCPGKLGFPSDILRPLRRAEDIALALEYITQAINIGVDHLNLSHTGHALQCWHNAKHAIDTYPEIFSKKARSTLKEHAAKLHDGRDWSKMHQGKDELLSVIRDNMAYVRIMRYAEMAINENRNTRDYYRYSDKYMQRPFDGIGGDEQEGSVQVDGQFTLSKRLSSGRPSAQ